MDDDAFRFGPVLKIGGAGDPPVPVGDPPTGTAASNVAKRTRPLARTVPPVPSGESPVLPANPFFKHALTQRVKGWLRVSCFLSARRWSFICSSIAVFEVSSPVVSRTGGHVLSSFSSLPSVTSNSRFQVQCRKWRTPVNTIASSRSSAAAMTSASRTEPPG